MAACRLRIVVYPELHRTWTARALEHDFAAEARSIELAVDAVVKFALAHIAHDLRHGREALSAFAPAPARYWTAFEAGMPLPISMDVPWSKDGRVAHISTAVARRHPAARLPLAERTA